jgi:hypothetical protein
LPHLRPCGLLDESRGKHATKHSRQTSHPIMQTMEPGEDWGWCYVNEIMVEPAPLQL